MTGIVRIITILIGLPAGSFLVCLNLTHTVLFFSLPMCANAQLRNFYGNLVAFLHGVWEDVTSLLPVPHGLSFLSRRARRTAANLRRYPQSLAGKEPATRRDSNAGIYPGLYPGMHPLIAQQRIKRLSALKSGHYLVFKQEGYLTGANKLFGNFYLRRFVQN